MSIKLSPLFSDGMVLQRNTDIIITGLCTQGGGVSVGFMGRGFTAQADPDGSFACNLGSYSEVCEPQTMKLTSGDSEIIINDILIGEVWLCSGQSNMELMLGRLAHNYPDDLTGANPLIRQFKVPQVYNFNEEADEFTLKDCGWEGFKPETAGSFTAVGYFFAKKLHERYGVPVGLFASAVGGTPVAAWMSRDMLKEFPDDIAEAEKYKDSAYIEKNIAEHEAYTQDYHRRLGEADLGFRENWAGADYDDSDWESVGFCSYVTQGTGVYWYRKTIDIPEALRGKDAVIFLGTAVDMDEVFINGEKLGVTYYRYPPREYGFTLPESGKLTVAIRLLCFGGWGGFTRGKEYFIGTENRTIDLGTEGWKRRFAAGFEDFKGQTFFQYKPTGLYNGMIAPLKGYRFKGVIWYQGESDTGNPDRYAEKLMTLIKGWRELFGNADMPFIQTLLAHYEFNGCYDLDGGDGWDRLRAQQKLCLALPKTGVALTLDLGEHNDLHPQNKRDVGERMARIAMRTAYGEALPPNVFEMYNC
jgi:sialate O-acetylesterase